MKFLMLTIFILGTFGAYAASYDCKSANYRIIIDDIVFDHGGLEVINPNYEINGKKNDGADVEIGQIYVTDEIFSASLRVDTVFNVFQVSAIKKGKGNKLEGKIYTKNISQNAICEIK